MKKESTPYKMMATKVSVESARLLDSIAKKHDLTAYTLIQMVCDTLIRYMDDAHNLSEDMSKLIRVFERMEGWSGQLNLADPTVKKSITDAIYFIAAEKKDGNRAAMVSSPFFGDRQVDYNIVHILEKVLCILFPVKYRRLRNVGVELDCKSCLETIDKLMDLHGEDPDDVTFRKEFEDNRRSEYGHEENTTPYRRKMRRSMETMKLFKNEQRQDI